ncbi:hypothetical protein D3C83_96820 [compost metagenome]
MALPVPMVEPAPGTFCTSTGCPSAWRIGSAINRAMRSVEPPAGNGTITVIWRLG